jgi:hypothetical protein
MVIDRRSRTTRAALRGAISVLALIATSMKSGVQDVRFRKWHKADLELPPFEVALWVRLGEGRSPVPPRLWVQVAQVRP